MYNTRKRIEAILILILVITSIMLASFYICENSHHDCNGEHCNTCRQLEKESELLKSITTIAILLIVLRLATREPTREFIAKTIYTKLTTPIELKVKQLN